MGEVAVEIVPEELGFAIEIGEIDVTECEMVNQFTRLARRAAAIHPRLRPGLRPCRAQGDGHGAGRPRAARRGMWRGGDAPAQDEEFVLSHSDNVEASGFVQHLKLPHYVDFQSELELVRALRAEVERRRRRQTDARARRRSRPA